MRTVVFVKSNLKGRHKIRRCKSSLWEARDVVRRSTQRGLTSNNKYGSYSREDTLCNVTDGGVPMRHGAPPQARRTAGAVAMLRPDRRAASTRLHRRGDRSPLPLDDLQSQQARRLRHVDASGGRLQPPGSRLPADARQRRRVHAGQLQRQSLAQDRV